MAFFALFELSTGTPARSELCGCSTPGLSPVVRALQRACAEAVERRDALVASIAVSAPQAVGTQADKQTNAHAKQTDRQTNTQIRQDNGANG